MKLDFRKAYDSIRWSFVDHVMANMGFEYTWRKWVMNCISSASMSILINGSPTKPFNMEKGDPLSPFLFILVAEVLNKMILKAVDKGIIQGLDIRKNKVRLTHLQFANDTILFCPAEDMSLINYKRILDCIGLMSRLSINFEKSAITSSNCLDHRVRSLERRLVFAVAELPIRYLGIQLGANHRKVATWRPIIDKIEKKLSGWKASLLSQAGKLVLIKTVLNSLPIFYLGLFKMPKSVAKKIISLQSRFFWSKGNGKRGLVSVSWN